MYIDTPYISEDGVGVDYADFYHFLNGLVDYDNWSEKIDYSTKNYRMQRVHNVWNDASEIRDAFIRLFQKFKDSILVISYRSNGIPTIDELIDILQSQGRKTSVNISSDIKYVLSKKKSKEVLIIAE